MYLGGNTCFAPCSALPVPAGTEMQQKVDSD